MKVATKLFTLFPGRATGKRQHWAGVKLHLGWRLFKRVAEVLALTPEKDKALKTDFLRPVGEAVLYIFDLGYWAYHLLDRIIEHEQHFLSRLRQDCNPPILAVRIQEMFGMTETPRIAGGRVPVLLHLLAPNMRPQQITDDLASFLNNTYQQVRKDLRGRYPKHAWPEDPASAAPTARAKPRA